MSSPLSRGEPNAIQRYGRRHPLASVSLGVVLYSTVTVFVRASSASGPVFSFWRLWFGVLVLGTVAAYHARRAGAWPTPRSLRFALAAGVAFGAHQLLLFSAVKLTSVADVTLVNTLAPLVTGVLAVPLFGERPGRGFRVWSFVAMVGAAVVVAGGATGPDGSVLGMALALGNVVVFTLFFLVSKASRDELDVMPFLAGSLFVAALIVSAFVLGTGQDPGSATSTDLAYAAIIAAGPGFLGHVAMTWPLAWVPANVPPVMRLAIPVLASTWAWSFLGEAISLAHAVGGAVVILGVAGAITSRSGRALVAEAADTTGDVVEDAADAPPVVTTTGAR